MDLQSSNTVAAGPLFIDLIRAQYATNLPAWGPPQTTLPQNLQLFDPRTSLPPLSFLVDGVYKIRYILRYLPPPSPLETTSFIDVPMYVGRPDREGPASNQDY